MTSTTAAELQRPPISPARRHVYVHSTQSLPAIATLPPSRPYDLTFQHPRRDFKTASRPIHLVTMADEPPKAATTSSSTAPPGHTIRRAFTIDETRRRPSLNPASSSESLRPKRRSSNFTDYSAEARSILNPRPSSADSEPESSSLASISLAFALLPAVAGAFFKDGGAVVTDLMLLGLSGVFLHWSVTQPWSWYHSAQQVRIEQEDNAEAVVDDESDSEGTVEGVLDDVPEEEEDVRDSKGSSSTNRNRNKETRAMSAEQRSALRELYIYEFLTLLACFAFPLLAAYLLHAIRAQLSRPSEGLVSNYNLTIFCMVSEMRVFSHMFKLVQSRTLHLQRIVNRNPYSPYPEQNSGRIDEVLSRLEKLENQAPQGDTPPEKKVEETAEKWKQEASLVRSVRSNIQPELDALNRAVRRYEKKATLLQMQTEGRFHVVDGRLEDAIALAAAAAKNSASHRSLLDRTLDTLTWAVLLPFNALLQLLLLPLKTVLLLVKGKKNEPPAKQRQSRSGRPPQRYNGDGVPSRVSKR